MTEHAKWAGPVVNPQGTGETGVDRPAAQTPIGALWELLTHDERLAVVVSQPFADLRFTLELAWEEIEPRDRNRLLYGFRRLTGFSSLIEAALR